MANGQQSGATNALDRQIGGSHYRGMAIQPVEYCFRNHIGKLEGDVIAYVSRWKLKGGIQDLEKAKHTLELLIELEKAEQARNAQVERDVRASVERTNDILGRRILGMDASLRDALAPLSQDASWTPPPG